MTTALHPVVIGALLGLLVGVVVAFVLIPLFIRSAQRAEMASSRPVVVRRALYPRGFRLIVPLVFAGAGAFLVNRFFEGGV